MWEGGGGVGAGEVGLHTHSVPPPCTKCEKNSLSFFKGSRIALMGSLKTHCKSACPRAQLAMSKLKIPNTVSCGPSISLW